ncbi:MAG: hypothetical protein ABR969_03270 [Sedimentisphaerales bacterium]|jgi:hypothetical protein
MKKFIAIAVCSLMGYLIVPAWANEKIGFTLGSDFYSKYVWRGQLINNDFVFQPSVTATYGKWTANVWGNVDLTDYHNKSGEFTEYDLTLDYSNKFSEDSKVGYSIGTIHYHFPSFSATDTTEIYWGFNFDVPLSPAIKVYHGLGNENGTYINASIGHTYEKVMTFTDKCYCNLQWGASLGWGSSTYNKDYWGVDEARLNDLAFTLGLPICFPGDWTVKPSINYVTLVDGKIRDTDVFSKSSDYFFTGIGISKSF